MKHAPQPKQIIAEMTLSRQRTPEIVVDAAVS
jgi:hypothetical protein